MTKKIPLKVSWPENGQFFTFCFLHIFSPIGLKGTFGGQKCPKRHTHTHTHCVRTDHNFAFHSWFLFQVNIEIKCSKFILVYLLIMLRHSARIHWLNYCSACAWPYFRSETLVTRDGRSRTNPCPRIKMPPRSPSIHWRHQ